MQHMPVKALTTYIVLLPSRPLVAHHLRCSGMLTSPPLGQPPRWMRDPGFVIRPAARKACGEYGERCRVARWGHCTTAGGFFGVFKSLLLASLTGCPSKSSGQRVNRVAINHARSSRFRKLPRVVKIQRVYGPCCHFGVYYV